MRMTLKIIVVEVQFTGDNQMQYTCNSTLLLMPIHTHVILHDDTVETFDIHVTTGDLYPPLFMFLELQLC